MTFPDPLVIAGAHQKNMHELLRKMQADAGCIRQLLVGRTARRKSDGVEFEIRDTRHGVGSFVSLYGRRTSARTGTRDRRLTRIGLVSDIELVQATAKEPA